MTCSQKITATARAETRVRQDEAAPTLRTKVRRQMLLLAAFLTASSGLPSAAHASTSGFALESELDQFISLIESGFGVTVATLIIIGCLLKAYWNSQRGQGFGGLATAVVVTFAILNIRSVMDFFFTAQGALM